LLLLAIKPQMKHREIAAAASLSLGKNNYCVNTLLKSGA